MTEYLMADESFHALEMYEISFAKYTENGHIVDTPWTIENRIHEYQREKYVYEKLVENKEKYKFNNEEVGIPPHGHAFRYYDYITYNLEILLKKIIFLFHIKKIFKMKEQELIKKVQDYLLKTNTIFVDNSIEYTGVRENHIISNENPKDYYLLSYHAIADKNDKYSTNHILY